MGIICEGVQDLDGTLYSHSQVSGVASLRYICAQIFSLTSLTVYLFGVSASYLAGEACEVVN
jgi:hypothetical protein